MEDKPSPNPSSNQTQPPAALVDYPCSSSESEHGLYSDFAPFYGSDSEQTLNIRAPPWLSIFTSSETTNPKSLELLKNGGGFLKKLAKSMSSENSNDSWDLTLGTYMKQIRKGNRVVHTRETRRISMRCENKKKKHKIHMSSPVIKRKRRVQHTLQIQPTKEIRDVEVNPRFKHFLRHSFVTRELLENFGVAEIGEWLDNYGLMPFVSSSAKGYSNLASEFFSNSVVTIDGLSILSNVQGKLITVSHVDFSAIMGVKPSVSEVSDSSAFRKEVFQFFFGNIGIEHDSLPYQFTSMLFTKFVHRVLHWVVTTILFPKEGTQLVTWGDLCLMFKMVKGMKIDFGRRIIELLGLSARGAHHQHMPYASMINNLLQTHEVPGTDNEMETWLRYTYLLKTTVKKSGFSEDANGKWVRIHSKHMLALEKVREDSNKKMEKRQKRNKGKDQKVTQLVDTDETENDIGCQPVDKVIYGKNPSLAAQTPSITDLNSSPIPNPDNQNVLLF